MSTPHVFSLKTDLASWWAVFACFAALKTAARSEQTRGLLLYQNLSVQTTLAFFFTRRPSKTSWLPMW